MVAAALSTSHIMPPIFSNFNRRGGPNMDIFRWTPVNKIPGNTAHITSAGNFSNPQGTTTGESFGNNALSAGFGTAIGASANSAGYGFAGGYNSSCANGQAVAICGQSTATNQFVSGLAGGSNMFGITDVYIGGGVTNSSPTNITYHATGGAGSNITAGNIIIAGGIGTGAGLGGNVNLSIALPTGSSSTLNSLVNVLTLSGTNGGVSIVSPSGTTVPLVLTPASGTTADICQWTNNFSTTVLGRVDGSGNINMSTPGNKLFISAQPTNTNCSCGSGVLATGGAASIATTVITATSLIFITDTSSSLTNVGNLFVRQQVPASGFVVASTNTADTSTFNWLVIN